MDNTTRLEKKQSSQTFTPEEAATFLGISIRTLAIWRSTGRYELPFIKIGRRVRYRRNDLEAWQASRSYTHTGQIGSKAS